MKTPRDIVATFSIVGFDPETQELGIAVQSKFVAVGAVVPWAKAGVGAVATQSYANTSFGPEGLELMAAGRSAQETLDLLLAQDEGREKRQVGIVDAQGRAATFTGSECFDWAGGVTGPHYTAQGNILVSEATVQAMSSTFEQTEGCLAERLLAALDAGQAAGGDSRGKQSAALLVVREKGGYGGYTDRAVDLRVDDHPEPIKELMRVYGIYSLYFADPATAKVAPIDETMYGEIVDALTQLSYLTAGERGEDAVYKAFTAFIQTENFEERQRPRGEVDQAVLEYLKQQAARA